MELKDYIIPLRRWWWLVIASTLVATLSSFVATRQQPPIYQARTTVMIGRAIDNPNPNGNDLYLSQQLANTYADVVKREPVRNATMAALGINWLPEYTVRVVPATQLLELAVTDVNPQRAQAVAAELANQLIKQSPTGTDQQVEKRQDFINAQLDDLEVKIKGTQDEISKKQTDLGSMFSARQIADTQTQIGGLQAKLTTLQANYAALLSNTQQGALNTISVIEPAQLPTVPVGPNKGATILLAAAIGFLLAAGAAYLLEYLDDTLKNPDDVQKELGLTTLGAVPVIAAAENSTELVALTSSHSAATEAYRVLRTNLQFASVDRPLRAIMVTSPAPTEGKSMTVANLGAAVAQAGKRVIVVDTDLHRPRLHKLFGLQNNVGVTSALLADYPSLDGLLQETEVPGLRVLTSGPLPPNPAELLGSSRMHALLAALQAQADMLIFDTPPAIALSDAAILSTQLDGVLLVLDSGRTRREVAKRALASLNQVQARVIGALINRVPANANGYYYYHYYYYGHYSNGRGDGDGDGTSGSTGRRRSRRGRGLFGLGRRKPVSAPPRAPQTVNSEAPTRK